MEFNMAIVNYKCPNCAAPLKFNPDKQLFSCEFCMSEFTEQKVQEIYAEREAKVNKQEQAEQQAQQARQTQKTDTAQNNAQQKQEEDAVVYNCPSCGAVVMTTASTAATTCFYCQNPVVLGGRLSGDFKPDRVIPFALSKKKAAQKFLEMCKKKKFLPKDFASEKQIEKMTGVYFPYWYIDEQKQANMVAKGNKIRTWRVGNKRYTETSVYQLERSGDLIIKNVFERALKSQDRDMLQCVHPFDLTQAKPFAMSYLSGFQAEKRDIEKAEINNAVQQQMQEYGKQLLKNTMSGYTGVVVQKYDDITELESWNYTLLPVWIVTYKFNNKIFPFAINGQTGKTFGKLPVSKGRLAILASIITAAVFILGTIGGYFLL
ncbi:MAG: TFIIB-type zinc ribbon-containing protein [Ruminococcus sp.]|nr:TFIIB-type zinc ribbon-containing protein [Ruminococcus sp.]